MKPRLFRSLQPVVVLGVVVFAPSPAGADPLDETGLGAAATGMAGARTAAAVGAEAAHVNPAGIALAMRPEVLIGWQYALAHLSLDEHPADVLDAHGTSIGLAIPFAVADVRLGAGLALYIPDQFVARLQLTPITEPHFVRFDSQSQRTVVEPVVAIAFGELSIGVGASLLAGARSRQLTFDVGVVGGDTQGNAHLDVATPVVVAPLAGIRWRPSRAVELGASFRGPLSLDLAIDIRANVHVPNVITGDTIISLRSVSFYTPMRAAIGAAVHPREDLTLTADLAWERWSALGSGVPDLRILLALDTAPPLVSSTHPPANFHDTWTPRLGAEWQSGSLRVRAGAGYLPSPVPTQTGLTSFADGTRILATLGAGIRLSPGGVFTQPIDFDLGIGWQHVAHELVHKDVTLQPGGAFSSGGDILQASASTTVRF